MTQQEFDTKCRLECERCRAGRPVRYRAATGEFVHAFTERGAFTHVLCAANQTRQEFKAEHAGG